ncbi:hypothetical protein D3C72_362530 [compost metagenome]
MGTVASTGTASWLAPSWCVETVGFLRKRLASIGTSVKATNIETNTAPATVKANSRIMRPTMPEAKPTGTNTATRVKVTANTAS